MIRVLIVTNERETSFGIAGRIAADPVIEVAGIAHSLEDALDFAGAHAVDLLFVRAHLWLGAENRTHAKYRARTAALPVVVFSQTESGPEVTSVLQTGASCLCPLNVDDKLLCEVIKRYAAVSNSLSTLLGQRAGIPEIIRRQFALGSWPETPRFVPQSTQFDLTESDRQILRMLGAGMPPTDIRDVLGISARSLEKQLSSIRQKLGLSKADNLSQFAAEKDFTIDPSSQNGDPDFAVGVALGERPTAGDDVLVVIVDPIAIRRKALAMRAGRNPDIQVVGAFTMISEAAASNTTGQCDVMILGTTAEELLNLDLVTTVIQQVGNIPIIAISDYLTNEMLLIAIGTGVADFVDSNVDRDELGRSIRRSANGEYPINERLGGSSWSLASGPSEPERAILRGFRDGHPDAEIRRTLGVGRWTFWQMRQTMLYRLALDTRANAVRVAILRGWIEPVPAPNHEVRPESGPTDSRPPA